ncbi:MipA/OmpV family protein [Hydrogenophaga sp. RWCD_12]|uniref:MipA/OmpV family protein n=1 Tax=Hydrogenophaga sp. RWCD_12 TaxID=3391190 RepID=UPI003985061D
MAQQPFPALCRLALALLAGCASFAASAAEEKPLWEAGMGVATVSFPAYRGSDQRQAFVLPTPYFVYRGEFLKADKDGVRAQLFDADRVKVTVSGALSPPAYSRDIKVREGMPDLRANFEVGPQVNLTLWESDNRRQELKLLLPLRAAFTLERSPRSIGWVFHPKFNVDFGGIPGLTGWNAGMQLGPLLGDGKQHQYFYGVDSANATVNRPAYQAKGGFAGMQYVLGVSKRYDKTWVGAFLRYDSLRGATFADSPLVRTRNYVAGGVAVSWILGESAERVLVND